MSPSGLKGCTISNINIQRRFMKIFCRVLASCSLQHYLQIYKINCPQRFFVFLFYYESKLMNLCLLFAKMKLNSVFQQNRQYSEL